MARESQTTGSEGLSRLRELSRPDQLPGSDIWHPHGVVRPEQKHVWNRGGFQDDSADGEMRGIPVLEFVVLFCQGS